MADVDALLLEARRRYEVQRWRDNTLSPVQLPAWDELGDERRAALRALVAEEQMITLDAFVAKYDGKYLDVDGSYGNQCADLANAYAEQVVGAKRFGGNAINAIQQYDHTHFRPISNTPTNVPPRGAVIVWGPNTVAGTGAVGHIAVVLQATVSDFTSFDQNYPTGTPCHTQHHSYDGVLTWMVPLTVASPAPVPGPPKDGHSAAKVLRRHGAALDERFNLNDLNDLLHKIKDTWPARYER